MAKATTSNRRLLTAFLIAPLVPVAIHSAIFWQVFYIAIPVALVCAYVLTIVVAVPFVSWLRMRGKFRLFPIVLLAGFLAAIPDLAITLGGFGAFGHLNDEWGNHLVLDGRLTWLGVLRLLVVRPICYWVLGATGGLVFWSIAKEQPGSTRAEIAI